MLNKRLKSMVLLLSLLAFVSQAVAAVGSGCVVEHQQSGAEMSQQMSGMNHSGMGHSGMDHSGMDHSGMDHSVMPDASVDQSDCCDAQQCAASHCFSGSSALTVSGYDPATFSSTQSIPDYTAIYTPADSGSLFRPPITH